MLNQVVYEKAQIPDERGRHLGLGTHRDGSCCLGLDGDNGPGLPNRVVRERLFTTFCTKSCVPSDRHAYGHERADALVQQPAVQLTVGFEAQPRREEAFPYQIYLVLDLALLPTRSWRAGHRFDKEMATHLQEAAVILPLLADEDRLDRRLHIIIDAARAGSAEEGKRLVVGIEDHFLRLARISPHIHHPAMAEPDMDNLYRRRHAIEHDDLVAPVKLVNLARRIIERHIGFCRHQAELLRPHPRIAPNRVVTAIVAQIAQVLEYPDQRQPFTLRLGLIGQQHAVGMVPPGTELWLRLTGPLVFELRHFTAQNLPHNFPRHAQLTEDRLDRFTLHPRKPTYL